ncbi:MAG: murein biosynthesis integral membrane protein MurJ [Candidatus Omnitrophica bacterium]|nr:murein biosynthesis integral membrane protein MurJ [Candidatus Omnitrophota bacterium]
MSTTHKRLARSAGIIGFGTSVSRLLGFIRDILIAKIFGTSIFADSFFVAFRIPNLLRDLVGEGAANAAFVPVFSEYLVKKDRNDYWNLINALFKLMAVLLAAVTILGVLLSPLIVRIIAPGFKVDPQKFVITVNLTRIIFPYIFFVGICAFLMAVMNSFKSFAAPAFSPAMLNICLIIGAVWWTKHLGIYGLAWAVLLGGVIQVLIQIIPLFKTGFRFNPKSSYRHPAIGKISRLLFPRFLGSCVYQINLFVDTILASLSGVVGAGGVSALYYSNRLVQFPLAIFGVAVAQAALPTMSTQSQENNLKNLAHTVSFSLRSVFFVTIPSAAGLMVLARPIVSVLFERGKFDTYSTGITSSALMFYSLGLFAYAGTKILVSVFYSMQDTFTPVKVASLSLIINVVLNLIFMFPLKVGGLALATSISATSNFLFLFILLKKRIADLKYKEIISSSLRILLASLSMAAVAKFTYLKIGVFLNREPSRIFATVLVSIISYIFFSVFFKVKELKNLKAWILKKK